MIDIDNKLARLNNIVPIKGRFTYRTGYNFPENEVLDTKLFKRERRANIDILKDIANQKSRHGINIPYFLQQFRQEVLK